jgi:hypothetical protein
MKRRRRPTDLPRERRIRAAFATLKQALEGNPALARRTRAVLAGRLPAPDLEGPTMSNDEQVAIRLSTALLSRSEKLAQRLATDPSHSAYRVSRSAVLRMALVRGLEVLEAEQAAKGKR